MKCSSHSRISLCTLLKRPKEIPKIPFYTVCWVPRTTSLGVGIFKPLVLWSAVPTALNVAFLNLYGTYRTITYLTLKNRKVSRFHNAAYNLIFVYDCSLVELSSFWKRGYTCPAPGPIFYSVTGGPAMIGL